MIMEDIYNWFWSPSIWVPPGFTWEVFDSKPGQQFRSCNDLWVYPFLFAALFLSLKYFVLTPLIFNPIGKFFKVRSRPYRHPPANETLEKLYRKHRSRAPYNLVKEKAAELGWNEREVQRWLRQKTVSQQVTTLEKFGDCAWQLTYYVSYCILGLVVLYDKLWFYDVRACWTKFPFHYFDNGLWWYYMVALGFYLGQTVTHFMQPQRSDSWQMLCHHLVTILLTSLSYVCNFMRIGSLILVVHECADIPLLLAKMCGYCGRQDLMDNMFVVFVLLWIITRLGIFPLKLIRSTLLEAHVQENMFFPVYYIFNGLLLAIFLMHLIWTYNIIQVIAHKFSSNRVTDVRSSASEMSDDGETYPPLKNKKRE